MTAYLPKLKVAFRLKPKKELPSGFIVCGVTLEMLGYYVYILKSPLDVIRCENGTRSTEVITNIYNVGGGTNSMGAS